MNRNFGGSFNKLFFTLKSTPYYNEDRNSFIRRISYEEKMLSILIAAAMLLSMLPMMGVSAEEAIVWPEVGQPVIIDGVEYTYAGEGETDDASIQITKDMLGTSLAVVMGDGYALWDGVSELVLCNLTMTVNPDYSSSLYTEIPLNIVLKGKNTITAANATDTLIGGIVLDYTSEETEGETEAEPYRSTISGDGSLEIRITNTYTSVEEYDYAYIYGIYSSQELEINGTTISVNITGKNGHSYGIQTHDTLKVTDADLNLTVTDTAYAAAIEGNALVNIQSSRIKFLASSDCENSNYVDGISIYHDLTLSDSIVIGDVATDTADCVAYGFYADGMLKIDHGCAIELNVQGNEELDSYAISGAAVSFSNSYFNITGNGITEAWYYEEDTDGNITTDYPIGEDENGDPITVDVFELKNTSIIQPADAQVKAVTYDETYNEETHSYTSTVIADKDDHYIYEYLMIPHVYEDVSADLWYADTVAFAHARGLFQGNEKGEFQPEANMTRAQMWTVLARLSGFDTTPDAEEEWYENAREWSMENGVSDGTNPNDNITREQMVTMLWRHLGEPESTGNLSAFPDGGQTSDWAKDALNWAVENGIINGNADGTLDPLGSATRAQIAQMIKNFLINY